MKCEKEMGGVGRHPKSAAAGHGFFQRANRWAQWVGLWITFPIIFFRQGESVIGSRFGECEGARNYTC